MSAARKTMSSTVLRVFSAVVRDLDAQDLEFLLNLDLHACGIRKFDVATRSLVAVQVPWPVAWLMTRHNRKHHFTCSRAPAEASVVAAINQLEAKAKWRWHFRASTSHRSPYHIRGLSCAPCTGCYDPALVAWLKHVRGEVMSCSRACRSRARSRSGGSNVSALHRWALEILHSEG